MNHKYQATRPFLAYEFLPKSYRFEVFQKSWQQLISSQLGDIQKWRRKMSGFRPHSFLRHFSHFFYYTPFPMSPGK